MDPRVSVSTASPPPPAVILKAIVATDAIPRPHEPDPRTLATSVDLILHLAIPRRQDADPRWGERVPVISMNRTEPLDNPSTFHSKIRLHEPHKGKRVRSASRRSCLRADLSPGLSKTCWRSSQWVSPTGYSSPGSRRQEACDKAEGRVSTQRICVTRAVFRALEAFVRVWASNILHHNHRLSDSYTRLRCIPEALQRVFTV